MTISIMGFAGLAILALGFLTYPVLRRRQLSVEDEDGNAEHRRTQRAWYQQRLEELNQEIQDSQAQEALQQELAAVLLAETETSKRVSSQSAKAPAGMLLIGLSAAVLLVSAVVYSGLADYRLPLIQGAEEILTLDERTQAASLRSWSQRLQRRLESSPEDAKSWYLLGHAQLKLGAAAAAAEAFATTDRFIDNDASVKFYWLQARLLASNGELDRVSEGIANELLRIDPNNGPVLEVLSVAMMQRGDLAEAIRLMNRAITASDNVDRQAGLAAAISVLRGRMETTAPNIVVQVSAPTAPADRAVVFVVARPPGGGMPFAAVRRPVSLLPFSVQLDDLVSMSEQRILSMAEEFEVLVRVSETGVAQANPGDWVWRSKVLTAEDLQLGTTLQAILRATE